MRAWGLYDIDDHVLTFIDNNVTLGSVVRGSSHLRAMNPMIHTIWADASRSTGRILWFEQVDSASNGSDAPSRWWGSGSYSFSGGYGQRVIATRRTYDDVTHGSDALVSASFVPGVPAVVGFQHA